MFNLQTLFLDDNGGMKELFAPFIIIGSDTAPSDAYLLSRVGTQATPIEEPR